MQPGVDHRRLRDGHHRQAGAAGQFVVGHPVAGEHDRVALDARAVGEHDGLHPAAADDLGDVDAGADRHLSRRRWPGRAARYVWWRASGVVMATVSHPAWRSVSTAEKLTCSAPTTTARRPDRSGGACTKLLQRAGGEHAGRAVAGNQARRAGPLADAGGEHHGVGVEGLDPARGGDLHLRPSQRRDGDAGAQVHARALGACGPGAAAYARAGGARRRRSRMPNPRWAVWRGMPPGLLLAFEHDHPSTPRRRSSMAAASPAGPPPTMTTRVAHDSPIQVAHRAAVGVGREGAHLGRAVEALAPPGERPGAAAQAVEVAGRARARCTASAISSAVTRSQWHTMVPPRRYGRSPASPSGVRRTVRQLVGRRGAASSPAVRSSVSASSASAIDAVRPVDRMPPRHT